MSFSQVIPWPLPPPSFSLCLPLRRPSQWLAPSVNALTRMVSSGGSATALRSIPELRLDAEPQPEKEANGLEEEKEVKEENGRALR